VRSEIHLDEFSEVGPDEPNIVFDAFDGCRFLKHGLCVFHVEHKVDLVVYALGTLEGFLVCEKQGAHADLFPALLEHLPLEGVRGGLRELHMPTRQVGILVFEVLAEQHASVLDEYAACNDFSGGGFRHRKMIFLISPSCRHEGTERLICARRYAMSSADKKQPKKTKRARLGRGLSSLVDAAPIQVESNHTSKAAQPETGDANINRTFGREQVMELSIEKVRPNPHQPRRVFETEALETLASSIKEHGLMQPIVVRAVAGVDEFELIAGERRWRAAKLAGLGTIRAIVDEADDERSAELALIENIQRADLNPIERATGMRQLMDRFGSTQQQLSERMGMSRSGLANLLRLLDLDEETRGHIASGAISVGHAKVLLSCEDHTMRAELARRAIAQGWTVRDLESAIDSLHSSHDESGAGAGNEQPETPGVTAATHPDRVGSVLRDLERSLSEHLGTRVVLKTNKQGTKGRVQIEFYDLDQFDGLLAKLGVQGELL